MKRIIGGGYGKIECSPWTSRSKYKFIQCQLRKYDYDLEAWQLAHSHLVYQAQPHFFQQTETREKWLSNQWT